MRYKTKTKDCHLIVTAKASWGEEIYEKALDVFARTYIRGFLKPKMIKKNIVEQLKASTLYRYQYLIDTHIRPELGSKSTEAITSTVINYYLADNLHNGRVDGSGGLSAAYVRSITLVINSALRFGMEQGLCSGTRFKINKPTVVPKELTILTSSEQRKLENMLQTDTDATKLGIMISLYTGLRIGEICALTWNDIDLKNKVICG